jgi:hypothetical protein
MPTNITVTVIFMALLLANIVPRFSPSLFVEQDYYAARDASYEAGLIRLRYGANSTSLYHTDR